MALQTSGQISLSDVEGEFGGTAPTSLSEYYDAAAGVPASGQIALSDFYGTSSVAVVTKRYHAFAASNTNSHSFGSVDIGTASSDRIVVVLAASFRGSPSGSFIREITSISINGTDEKIQVNTLTGGASTGFGSAVVSSGTTATIAVTTDGNSDCAVAVYTITNATDGTPDDYEVTESSGAPSVSVTAAGKGVVVGHFAYYGTSGGGSISGLSGTESRVHTTASTDKGHIAQFIVGGSGSYTISGNDNGSSQSIQGIVYE